MIAAQRWPDNTVAHAYDASRAAAAERAALIAARRSFITETVFSHPSKIELLEQARTRGYLTTLHVVMVPEDLSVVRVGLRVRAGGHDVPEAKIRARHRRLFALIADAVDAVDETVVYDNSRARPAFRVVARFERGRVVGAPDWPRWTPDALQALTR